jgi:hypothetical protein
MRVGLSRRILSYVIDAAPILAIVFVLHSLFVGGMIENQIPNYTEHRETYTINYEIYSNELLELSKIMKKV